MLSPGKFHLKVPRDRERNLRWRKFILQKAAADPNVQRGLVEACRQDIIFYIATFVWQFNPTKRSKGRIGPFIPWDFQEEALVGPRGILWHYENDRSVVVEKSREMGASWLFLIVQDWLGLFEDWFQSLNISRSAEAVDDKSMDSLFAKVRFMHEYLPGWLKGRILEEKMYFEYKRTRSTVTGEASTGKAGVGGRAAVIFIDEFPRITQAVEVREGTASTANCRFFNGTHLGTDTEFYRLTQTPEISKMVMHWTQHPDKKKGLYRWDAAQQRVEIIDKTYVFPHNYQFITDGTPTGGPFPGLRSPWYDAKAREIGSARGVAMELDIDPKGSSSQVFNTLRIRELQHQFCRPPYWEGDVLVDRDTAKVVQLVPRDGGPLQLWLTMTPENAPPKSLYRVGADIAEGMGASPSVLSFADAKKGEKVACYLNANIKPYELARIAHALCWWFQDEDGRGAKISWELPGPGRDFGDVLTNELAYTNVYFREQSAGSMWAKESDKPGWVNNNQSKLFLVKQYEAALYSMQFINRCELALEECLAFKYKPDGFIEHSGEKSPKDPSGARVNHGDRVIADAQAWMLCKGMAKAEKQKEEQTAKPGSLAWRRMYHENLKRLEESWQ